MSFVISRKQYLAPSESRVQYEPLIFEEEGFEVKKIDVTFGHPLYTTVADNFLHKIDFRRAKDSADNSRWLHDACFFSEIKRKKIYRHIYAEFTDEIKKISIEPGEYYIFIRFLPGIGFSLINQPANKLTNKALPLKGNLGRRRADNIYFGKGNAADRKDKAHIEGNTCQFSFRVKQVSDKILYRKDTSDAGKYKSRRTRGRNRIHIQTYRKNVRKMCRHIAQAVFTDNKAAAVYDENTGGQEHAACGYSDRQRIF